MLNVFDTNDMKKTVLEHLYSKRKNKTVWIYPEM